MICQLWTAKDVVPVSLHLSVLSFPPPNSQLFQSLAHHITPNELRLSFLVKSNQTLGSLHFFQSFLNKVPSILMTKGRDTGAAPSANEMERNTTAKSALEKARCWKWKHFHTKNKGPGWKHGANIQPAAQWYRRGTR